MVKKATSAVRVSASHQRTITQVVVSPSALGLLQYDSG